MAKPHFKDWLAFEAYLEGLGFFHMELGLERIGAVLDKLGLRRLPCPTVQVVGTNGKGSTSTFLCSLARARGFKAVLHSSPHFVSVRERVRVFAPGAHNGGVFGDMLPEARWLEAAGEVMGAGGEKLTYFELITAMAVWMIKAEDADLAVLESGLGGSHDATTAMQADGVLFTPIALDHQAVLGDTVAEIARDKSGAMRRGRWALSAGQTEDARRVLEEAARAKEAELFFSSPGDLPEGFGDGMSLGIKGWHQRGNAALALKAWRRLSEGLRLEPDAGAEARGLAEARIPGRMQFIQPAPKKSPSRSPNGAPPHPPLIVDGAHNAHGLAALGLSLARLGIAPAAVIFNCMRDKEPEALLPHLRALSTGPIFVPEIKDNPRAMPAAELAAMIGLAATPARNIEEALGLAALSMRERLPEEHNRDIHECGRPLLVCGSLYLLGEFFALSPQYLTKDSA